MLVRDDPTADLVVMAVGVRPNGELARAADRGKQARGRGDANLRTSDHIYAVGDVIEVEVISSKPDHDCARQSANAGG